MTFSIPTCRSVVSLHRARISAASRRPSSNAAPHTPCTLGTLWWRAWGTWSWRHRRHVSPSTSGGFWWTFGWAWGWLRGSCRKCRGNWSSSVPVAGSSSCRLAGVVTFLYSVKKIPWTVTKTGDDGANSKVIMEWDTLSSFKRLVPLHREVEILCTPRKWPGDKFVSLKQSWNELNFLRSQ